MKEKGKYINLEYLDTISGGSKSLVKEMAEIFLEQVPEFTREMKELLEKKDYQSLGLLAHKAKSSVAIMGMNELAEELKDFEQLTKEMKEVERYPSFVERFERSCFEAVQELNEIIENL